MTASWSNWPRCPIPISCRPRSLASSGLILVDDDLRRNRRARHWRAELLLVLDNCEHVIDKAAELTEIMMRLFPAPPTVPCDKPDFLRIDGEYVIAFRHSMCHRSIERTRTTCLGTVRSGCSLPGRRRCSQTSLYTGRVFQNCRNLLASRRYPARH